MCESALSLSLVWYVLLEIFHVSVQKIFQIQKKKRDKGAGICRGVTLSQFMSTLV